MFEIGRVCIKIAGRDAKGIAVIIDHLDNNRVLIEGTVRRRACNPLHLEPTKDILSIKKNASKEEVLAGLKTLGYDVAPQAKTKEKKTSTAPRPKKQKKTKQQEQVQPKKATSEKANTENQSKSTTATKKQQKQMPKQQ